MGKALIISEQGAGEYTAQVVYDTARAEAQLQLLADKISDVTAKLSSVTVELIAKQGEIDAIQSELTAAINAGEKPDELFAIVKKLEKPSKELAEIRSRKNTLAAEKLGAEKRSEFIQNNTPTATNMTMWCADYSEGLTGEVGTIEVNGTLDAPPIIYPYQVEELAYSSARDNQIQPIISSGAPAVYFNRALLPGWQKWLPTYRVGTITSKSGDVCNVSLDEALGQQSLDINQASTLSSVQIEYMEQNGTVFETGDRVVVRFENQDWAQPKVVGFESNPKPEALVWLLNDTFSTGNAQVYINLHNPDGSNPKSVTTPTNHAGYARRLARSDSDLYYYLYDSNVQAHTLVRATSSGQTIGIANDCDRLFGVNSTHVFYYEADFQVYSKKIIKRDRLTGALVSSFNATIPGQSVGEEERPVWLDCNDTYVYWLMSPDTYNNSPFRLCRSDLDGNNHEVVATYPFTSMPGLGDGSWRGFHVTNDRIYVPDGFTSGTDSGAWVPIQCYVYDLNMSWLATFGPLPYANGVNGTSAEECQGMAANDYMIAWLEDNYNFGVYLHVWDRVVTRDGSGNITSETFTKRSQTPVNLRSSYGGIKGGIAV